MKKVRPTLTYPVLRSKFKCMFCTCPYSPNNSLISSSEASSWMFVAMMIQPSIERTAIASAEVFASVFVLVVDGAASMSISASAIFAVVDLGVNGDGGVMRVRRWLLNIAIDGGGFVDMQCLKGWRSKIVDCWWLICCEALQCNKSFSDRENHLNRIR